MWDIRLKHASNVASTHAATSKQGLVLYSYEPVFYEAFSSNAGTMFEQGTRSHGTMHCGNRKDS